MQRYWLSHERPHAHMHSGDTPVYLAVDVEAVRQKVKALLKAHDGKQLTPAGYAYDAALEQVRDWLD